MIESVFLEKLKQYFKILVLGFFVNAIPYLIADLWITQYDLKPSMLKTILVLLSWIFLSGTVYFFGEDIKEGIESIDMIKYKWWIVFGCIILSLVYIVLLSHAISYDTGK